MKTNKNNENIIEVVLRKWENGIDTNQLLKLELPMNDKELKAILIDFLGEEFWNHVNINEYDYIGIEMGSCDDIFVMNDFLIAVNFPKLNEAKLNFLLGLIHFVDLADIEFIFDKEDLMKYTRIKVDYMSEEDREREDEVEFIQDVLEGKCGNLSYTSNLDADYEDDLDEILTKLSNGEDLPKRKSNLYNCPHCSEKCQGIKLVHDTYHDKTYCRRTGKLLNSYYVGD